MAHEIEIKLQVKDLGSVPSGAEGHGRATVFGGTGRVHEWNTLFDTAAAGSAEAGAIAADSRRRLQTEHVVAELRKAADAERVHFLTFKAAGCRAGDDEAVDSNVRRAATQGPGGD